MKKISLITLSKFRGPFLVLDLVWVDPGQVDPLDPFQEGQL